MPASALGPRAGRAAPPRAARRADRLIGSSARRHAGRAAPHGCNGRFVYCRLHGSQELYVSGYDDATLDAWPRRLRAWVRGSETGDAERIDGPVKKTGLGRDVFVFFDNDAKARAPIDAEALERRLGIGPSG